MLIGFYIYILENIICIFMILNVEVINECFLKYNIEDGDRVGSCDIVILWFFGILKGFRWFYYWSLVCKIIVFFVFVDKDLNKL